jgi:DNA polymerase III alpha subunit
LPRFYPNANEEIKQRLEYELNVVKNTQFANYFLVVWDIISFVRKENILFGVRGSAAASIILHCLGITELDPIEHRLVFERFLNMERKEMPDVDLDCHLLCLTEVRAGPRCSDYHIRDTRCTGGIARCWAGAGHDLC